MNNHCIISTRHFVAGFVLLSAMAVGCSKDDASAGTTNTRYTLSGAGTALQVVPSFSGSGTGTISGKYDRSTNRLDYTIGWNGLTANASKVGFYTGSAGKAGTQVQAVDISVPGITGGATGFITLTEQQETDLLSGHMYYSEQQRLTPMAKYADKSPHRNKLSFLL